MSSISQGLKHIIILSEDMGIKEEQIVTFELDLKAYKLFVHKLGSNYLDHYKEIYVM